MANSEQMESELVSLNGKIVVVVRPFYGSQSDSFVGQLSVLDGYPIRFHFSQTGKAILFTIDDVVKLDKSIDNQTERIIRLKGPHDYAESYQRSNA